MQEFSLRKTKCKQNLSKSREGEGASVLLIRLRQNKNERFMKINECILGTV